MERRLVRMVGFFLALLWSLGGLAEEVSDTERLIEQKLEQRWQEYMASDAFEKRVEAVIIQFVEKQRQARAEQQRSARDALMANVAPVDPERDHIRGVPDAEFTLIEYSDYECPYCKRFHATATEFIQRNPEVNWVYRHFPLDFHNPGAQKQAEGAECAAAVGGHDSFWRFSDLIFARTRSNGKGFPVDRLVPLAVEIGLDKQAFQRCFDDQQFRQKVLSDLENGQRSGVTGTPGNFLRHNPTGTMMAISGAQPLAALEGALQSLRDQAL